MLKYKIPQIVTLTPEKCNETVIDINKKELSH